jgi:transcriptional regulator with XRE-family HTH domain
MERLTKLSPHAGLKKAREAYGWMQKDVAEKIGISSLILHQWEEGITFPGCYFREKLGGLYKQSIQALGLLPLSDNQVETSKKSSVFGGMGKKASRSGLQFVSN